MPAFPTNQHTWDSDVKAVASTVIDTMESGAQHSYIKSGKDWFDITLNTMIYHEDNRATANQIDQFYLTNRLAENITFECLGANYIGQFIERPVVTQQAGFGIWLIVCKFRAEKI